MTIEETSRLILVSQASALQSLFGTGDSCVVCDLI